MKIANFIPKPGDKYTYDGYAGIMTVTRYDGKSNIHSIGTEFRPGVEVLWSYDSTNQGYDWFPKKKALVIIKGEL